MGMYSDLETILYTEEQINERVRQLAAEITRDYAGREISVVGILRGSFIFMADLVRRLDCHCLLDFMSVSSYGGGTVTSGEVRVKQDLRMHAEGKDLLIVEDIVDTGYTMDGLLRLLSTRKPNSIKICTLLSKPSRREVEVPVDYCGFEVPDVFVVGYGLDYADKYRNLPIIGVLKSEIYNKPGEKH